MPALADNPRPALAFAIATSLGLGRMPVAPGTWGSAVGVALAAAVAAFSRSFSGATLVAAAFGFTCLVAVVGLWASAQVAKFSRASDPQFVVIDEVSGQTIALVLGSAFSATFTRGTFPAAFTHNLLDWKYLLAGFILFRVFDIWKPFPARNAESLHGGLGIMADDWIAGAYGALGLCLARYLGL